MVQIAAIVCLDVSGTASNTSILLKRVFKPRIEQKSLVRIDFLFKDPYVMKLAEVVAQNGTKDQRPGQVSLSTQDFPLLEQAQNRYSVVFTILNQVCFLALCQEKACYACELLEIYQHLKLLSELIEEAAQPSIDLNNQHEQSQSSCIEFIKENSSGISLTIDTIFDYGVPNVVNRATLSALLDKNKGNSYLNKANEMIGYHKNHQRICNQLSQAVNQLPENPDAFWRVKNNFLQTQQQKQSINMVSKEMKLNYSEKFDCIVAKDGKILSQDLEGTATIETSLQQTDLKISSKIRLGQRHRMCAMTSNKYCSHAEIVEIGSDKFSLHTILPPQSGKQILVKFQFSEDEPLVLPFHLRASYTFEEKVCKFFCKFELNRSLLKQSATKSQSESYLAPEQIQIKFHFPNEVTAAALMPSSGNFQFKDGQGLWQIPNLLQDNASSSKTKGLLEDVTIEGRLRLSESIESEFQTQLSATVCLKIPNFLLSGTAIESFSSHQKSTASQSKEDNYINKLVSVATYAKNVHFRL